MAYIFAAEDLFQNKNERPESKKAKIFEILSDVCKYG